MITYSTFLSVLLSVLSSRPFTAHTGSTSQNSRTSMSLNDRWQKVTFVPRKTGICRHTQGRVEVIFARYWCDHVHMLQSLPEMVKKRKSMKCVLRQQQHEVLPPHRSKTVPGSWKSLFSPALKKLEHDKWAAMHVRRAKQTKLMCRSGFPNPFSSPDRYQPMSWDFFLAC